MDEIKEYLLNNMELVKELVQELNGWNGCLDFLDYMENDEDFFETYYSNRPMEAVRACCYGDYNYMDDYVHINVYGNLETCNEWELQAKIKDYIDEIIEALLENKENITIYDEKLIELLK